MYLPNSTRTQASTNITGLLMPTNSRVHGAFTWSTKNGARLYTSPYLQNQYRGTANCQGIQGINISQPFMGLLDEVYIFAQELQEKDLQAIVKSCYGKLERIICCVLDMFIWILFLINNEKSKY